MDTYICASCKTKKQSGDKVYCVLDTDGAYEACCSVKCAEDIKLRNIERVRNILNRISNQNIEEEIWE